MKSTGNAGSRVQERREALEMTRSELAKKLKISPLKLWRIETGKTRLIADDLPSYAKALKTTIEDLLA